MDTPRCASLPHKTKHPTPCKKPRQFRSSFMPKLTKLRIIFYLLATLEIVLLTGYYAGEKFLLR